ncbi:MAG: DUF5522 domain-containing protein [Bacteroidota bacterium]|nr:DUF5522 domain-containing protein [Bacteroidota bacterium]
MPDSEDAEFLILNEDYTIEDGLYVFTREYHLKRGYCCESGCKNCPYPLPTDK